MRSLFIICLIISSTRSQPEPCDFKEDYPNAACKPCLQDKWLDLVQPSGGPETITNPEKDCFNKDPVKIEHLNPNAATVENDELVAAGEFKYNSILGPLGFVIRKHPFFRYAYAPSSSNGTVTKAYHDLDKVKKYFVREEIPGVSTKEDADIQLLEWPGRESDAEHEALQQNAINRLPIECRTDPSWSLLDRCQESKFWMLEFDRDNGKVQHYPCNAQEGTDIVAVGSVMQITDEDRASINPFTESEQKIWLSFGKKSIYKNYLQPLHIPQRILEEMAKPDPLPSDRTGFLCIKKERDCLGALSIHQECKKRCQELKNKGHEFSRDPENCYKHVRNMTDPDTKNLYTFGDLRTVMDFTFTRMRLILAMRCGIIVVTNILTNDLHFRVSVLRSEDGSGKQFPDPINKISASTCCSKSEDCDKDDGIVAAYSFQQQRSDDANKFLYVSFNLGDTFEKRIIGTPYSPVNLIKGLYKMYMRWHHYYEILGNPDEQDLEEDDVLLSTLREKSFWESSTMEEKEKLFSVGKAKTEKTDTTFQKIQEIITNRVPKREARLDKDKGPNINDFTPEWANEIIDKRRRQHGWQDGWNDTNCDDIPECINKFENDKAITWLFNKSDVPIIVKTPKRNEDEPFCREITSVLVLPEKKHVMALCEIKYQRSSLDGTGSPIKSPPPPDINYFALYSYPIKENIPLIYGERVSKRIFSCKYIKYDEGQPKRLIQPELVRMPGSATIFVINCDGVIYMSTNFGKTLFNSVFYFEREKMHEYCKQNPNYTEPTTSPETICKEKKLASSAPPTTPTPTSMSFLRSFSLCALDTPPLLITDVTGTILLLTFGRFYARGVISYNKEARLIVGESVSSGTSSGTALTDEFPWEERFRNLIFPSLDTNGEAILTIALLDAYTVARDDNLFRDLYTHKHAMRLITMPIQIHRDVKNFYDENLSLCHQAYRKKFGFERCQTNSFYLHPKKVSMDIGESKTVSVRVKDDNPLLPLWLFSSDENSVGVKATLNREPGQVLNLHSWILDITAKPNVKNEEEAESLVDAFFGSDYNNLHDYSAQITLVNLPTVRCHVQPSSTIQAGIGCKGKKLVAHEDAHRPQCKSFRSNFNYTLKRGFFDPALANYWLEVDKQQKRPFFKLLDNGDLRITYDFSRWGCPIEPFRNDPFVPDLRIVDETNYNDTSKGKRFEGKFILIEIFGAVGYNYSHLVGDPHTNCQRTSQDLNDLVLSWKYRQRLFQVAAKRLSFPLIGDKRTFENVTGNRCFQNEAVRQHTNIWNRANYISCEHPPVVPSQVLTDKIGRGEYQIMTTGTSADEGDVSEAFINLDDEKFLDESDNIEEINEEMLNKVEWRRDHQRVYIFLAIAVDGFGSLCNYQTVFGVSLNTTPQMDNFISFIVFLFFWLFWILLVVGGYHVRRRYLRISFMNQARADKLEEAAWKIVYRYEKLIHGKEMGHLMQLNPEDDEKSKPGTSATYAARTAHDKRKAELRMKKTHIMAQEQARHERLQKLFQKQ
ncbi:unnamed protein product [Orchesella dallaii]|uniref:Uncharacterized protein n=1 Tax=Orchesella dallaii TaxID=48710 RepID=A0ABP1R0U1_9HEXA